MGGGWLTPRSGRFFYEETTTIAHLICSWVDLRSGLDSVTKEKIPTPARNRICGLVLHMSTEFWKIHQVSCVWTIWT